MKHEPTIVTTASLPEAWDATITKLRGRPDGAIPNLIVHVESPTRELPSGFSGSPESVENWANELQSGMPERLPFTHGERIRRWLVQTIGGQYSFLDQIDDFVVPMLARNPQTKRALLQVADPNQDAVVSDDPIPALQLIQFSIDETKLVCTAYYRAQEMYLFWLVNMYELISLQEYICKRITERSPQLLPTPGSITTHAFLAYANPTDLLTQRSNQGSSTLAIERLELSKIHLETFDALLVEAFSARDKSALDRLFEMLEIDLLKLDRVRDMDYRALERLQIYLAEHSPADMPEFADSARLLFSEVVALDMDLERGRSLEELNANLNRARTAWHELLTRINVLRTNS